MNTPAPPAPDLSAPKILLMGPPGTGKTWSIHTMLAAGLEVFVMATEANAIDSIIDACARTKTSTDKLHWKYILPAAASWSSLLSMAKFSNQMGYEDLAKIKSGIDRNKTDQIRGLIETLQDFKCDHCGKSFGDCALWGVDRALILDSLSGLNLLARYNHAGFKPTLHQGEWGVMMSMEETLITGLCNGLKCWFVLLAHIDREANQVTGGTTITPAALGTKLGPKLGRDFSEVVLAKREKDQFIWSTSEAQTDVKNRALPISDRLAPTFTPIVDALKRRQSQVTASSPTVPRV